MFHMDIPESYPFKVVDVLAEQPIWHPNIDLTSGRVVLPIEWSPVITLNSLALAVQVVVINKYLIVFIKINHIILFSDDNVGAKSRQSYEY